MNNNQNLILYSTGCPVCNMLKMRLEKEGFEYITVTDTSTMQKLGIKSAPILSVDGKLLTAMEAVKWIAARVAEEKGK